MIIYIILGGVLVAWLLNRIDNNSPPPPNNPMGPAEAWFHINEMDRWNPW